MGVDERYKIYAGDGGPGDFALLLLDSQTGSSWFLKKKSKDSLAWIQIGGTPGSDTPVTPAQGASEVVQGDEHPS
jgi:hypothetical protein